MQVSFYTLEPSMASFNLPCANNCGFYGDPDSYGYCSACWRDIRPKEPQHPGEHQHPGAGAPVVQNRLVNMIVCNASERQL